MTLSQSSSQKDLFYEVDLEKKTCNCPAFKFGQRPCKHLKEVAKDQGVDLPQEKKSYAGKGNDLGPEYYAQEAFGRTRLSKNFIMRDFLYSSYTEHFGIRNTPDNPEMVIRAGKALCERFLEPVTAQFGRCPITYGYCNREGMDYGGRHKGKSSSPHHWDRGTFGDEVYARIDVLPLCVEDGEVTKEEFGRWVMYNLDIDLLMQWAKSNVFCVTIGPKPRRVWLEWVQQGKGDNGSNRITFMGANYWQNVYPTAPQELRPKFGPSMSGGNMWWDKTK